MNDFKPWRLLKSPLLQTIVASKLHWRRPPPSTTKLIALQDQDQLALEISTPKNWNSKQPTVMMLHGLGGYHNSSYLVRLSHKILKLGNTRVIRMNFRGCGSGKGLAKGFYHSGRSEDVFNVLSHLKSETPDSAFYLLGFSLGGNVALKLAGELADKAKLLLNKVIAVCPPMNLLACAELLDKPENHVFRRYFLNKLLKFVKERHQSFPELGTLPPLVYQSIMEFDNCYTAPLSGFLDAKEYYQRSSSKDLIKNIAVPCHILMSEDDPFIHCQFKADHSLPEHIQLLITKAGGHMGYLSSPFSKTGFRWMDKTILEWLALEKSLPASL
ncbi:MAG: hypothetical protein K0R66_965 [Gammaproteobacteria bacterium]|jgi:predicted alpha/beta-fold hydrolase|nr:hypothetical protein [Gammaproteobacteria bacterium]